jgi:hypothetical protein
MPTLHQQSKHELTGFVLVPLFTQGRPFYLRSGTLCLPAEAH